MEIKKITTLEVVELTSEEQDAIYEAMTICQNIVRTMTENNLDGIVGLSGMVITDYAEMLDVIDILNDIVDIRALVK